jgi:hypothetical protein
MKLEAHPTVQRMHLKTVPSVPPKQESLDAGWLKQLVLDAGADDVGFVEIGRPALDGQREDIFRVARSPAPHYPQTTSDQAHSRLISAITAPQTPHWRPPRGWRLRRPAADRHAARCASRDLCSGARHSAPCALGG